MKKTLCIIIMLLGCNLSDDFEETKTTNEGAVCNNNLIESGEECDTSIPNGISCQSLGLSGEVSCNSECKIDYSNCLDETTCGNGLIEDDEECDPSIPLPNNSCQEFGIGIGDIICTDDCQIDPRSCGILACGDGELSDGETCDGDDLFGKTCESEKGPGWSGELSCNDCSLDTDDCELDIKPQIVSARDFNCRLKKDGKVDCWNNSNVLPNDGTYTKISTGGRHVCGLKSDNTVECWGENGFGEADAPNEFFKDIIAELRYSCGLTLVGDIQCWGRENEGLQIPPAGEFTQLNGGKRHACALDIENTVKCWGTWQNGPQFKQWTATDEAYVSVSAGLNYDCFLNEAGYASCITENGTIYKDGPFAKLSTNTEHTCGLKTDGAIECWGDSQFGKTDSQSGPFIDVSTGPHHSCGMRSDQSVECWGINPANIDPTNALFFKGQTQNRGAPPR